jgi:hypothetical protein
MTMTLTVSRSRLPSQAQPRGGRETNAAERLVIKHTKNSAPPRLRTQVNRNSDA